MRRWDRLSDRQLAVLERVGAGDDLSGPDGVPDRRSAVSLQDRGLVTVRRGGGQWRAEITDGGRYYLANGRHPDAPSDTEAPARQRDVDKSSESSSAGTATTAKRRPPKATAEVAAKRRAAVARLLQDLRESGWVVFESPSDDEVAELRRTIDFAKRHGLEPPGRRIQKTSMYDGRIRITLGNDWSAEDPTPPAQPVPVPPDVDVWHPLLAALGDRGGALGVSADAAQRASRIMHALLVEAEQRGYEVAWSSDGTHGIEIRIQGYPQNVSLEEEWSHREVMPTADEADAQGLYSWQRVRPRVQSEPSGKLAMRLLSDRRFGRQRRWADSQRWSLEDRLGHVLAAAEGAAAEQEQRRRSDELARQRHEREREEAAARARRSFLHKRRVEALMKQVEGWEQAVRIRAFCDEAERRGNADLDWLSWARNYADQVDPTAHKVKGPDDAEPRPKDLRP